MNPRINKLTWIACGIALLIMLLWTSGALAQERAEWLACDPPDPAENVTSYAVTVYTQPEQIVPLTLSASGNDVLLLNVTALIDAQITVQAINAQGRRSDLVPFDLLPKPSESSGMRVVQE